MHTLVCYDISSNRTRARFHLFLKEYGLNTQKSFFECDLDQRGLSIIQHEAHQIFDEERDNLRIYKLCRGCQRRVSVSGLGLTIVPWDFCIV